MFKFIGKGSAFNTSIGNNSAYIKEGKTLFMIDCGSANFDRILKANLLDGIDNIHVLVTHTHPDHIGSLGDLIFYAFYNIKPMFEPKVTVHFPSNLQVDTILKLMGVSYKTYNIKNFVCESMLINDDLKLAFEAIRVTHVPELISYAYMIQSRQTRHMTYYSGDSNMIPIDVLYFLSKGQIDYFYQDTCKADYDGNVHLSLRRLTEIVPKNLRSKVYCMHLDNSFNAEEAEALGFNVVGAEV